jgi:hypothetical protein
VIVATTRPRRTRPAITVTLGRLSIQQILGLMVGIRIPAATPFEASRITFSSYSDLLDTYRAVRVEMVDRWPGDVPTWFGEKLHAAVETSPGVDVEVVGARVYRKLYGGSRRC